MKFPSHLNFVGKIVSEMGSRLRSISLKIFYIRIQIPGPHRNSNKVIARNFAHDTAVLSWNMQNLVVVWYPSMKLPDYTVLSKVENSGSPNGPTMVDCWVVRVTFGWLVCMMWSEMKLQCCYVLFISNSTKRCEIDILSSILCSRWKFTGSSAAILPSRLSHFKVNDCSIRHDLATLGSWDKTAYSLVNRVLFNVIDAKRRKTFGNSLVAKQTTLGAIMGCPLCLWVAFGNQGTVFG